MGKEPTKFDLYIAYQNVSCLEVNVSRSLLLVRFLYQSNGTVGLLLIESFWSQNKLHSQRDGSKLQNYQRQLILHFAMETATLATDKAKMINKQM